ncbi:hypothetical protein Peur_018052 [Populus x canadensis]
MRPNYMLSKYSTDHPRTVTKATVIARWTQKHGKMAAVSAAFESGLAISPGIRYDPCSGFVEAPAAAATQILHKFQANHSLNFNSRASSLPVNSKDFSHPSKSIGLDATPMSENLTVQCKPETYSDLVHYTILIAFDRGSKGYASIVDAKIRWSTSFLTSFAYVRTRFGTI